jgi:hypothetical protein
VGKLGKGIAKEDQIVIVGGPGNNLDRHYHAMEKEFQHPPA